MFNMIYNNLCRSRSQLKNLWVKGSNIHRHHIIPKHQGGLDEETNYTYLSVREHIIAHYLLWKIHKKPNDLRAMHMLGCNLTSEQRKTIGIWCKDNNIGIFDPTKNFKSEWSKRGAKTQMDKKIGIHNPDNFKKNASFGGKAGAKIQMDKKIGIHNPDNFKKNSSLGGKALKNMVCVTNGKHRTRIHPERLEEFLSNGYIKGFVLFTDI